MADITDLPVMRAADAEAIGFARFNDVPHKVFDIPDGGFTLSTRTSDGNRVTFFFCRSKHDGPPGIIDIQFHDRGSTIPDANGGRAPTFDSLAITKGGAHVVDSRPLPKVRKPSILVLLLDRIDDGSDTEQPR
ncbi:hypothetical protein [Croceicoccus marinus]|uniref:Uncharacterized protein n=1 Tax=Croceicoccus marinus TaxID=450378 RepID=A0A7G6W1E4_9SPHN|nr:hypothetical protein [Croceicoccus marinus]QNE07809.1 hypothetical protein H4O24_19915 [Croceicoccus marinus]